MAKREEIETVSLPDSQESKNCEEIRESKMNILGIGYSMHESSACLVRDRELIFASAEERISRKKQDASVPRTGNPGGVGLRGHDPRGRGPRGNRLAAALGHVRA